MNSYMPGTLDPFVQQAMMQQQPYMDALRQPQQYDEPGRAQTQLQPVTADAGNALAQPLGMMLGGAGEYMKKNYDISKKYGTGFMTEQTRQLQAADEGF